MSVLQVQTSIGGQVLALSTLLFYTQKLTFSKSIVKFNFTCGEKEVMMEIKRKYEKYIVLDEDTYERRLEEPLDGKKHIFRKVFEILLESKRGFMHTLDQEIDLPI